MVAEPDVALRHDPSSVKLKSITLYSELGRKKITGSYLETKLGRNSNNCVQTDNGGTPIAEMPGVTAELFFSSHSGKTSQNNHDRASPRSWTTAHPEAIHVVEFAMK